jgi:hypothetical protein
MAFDDVVPLLADTHVVAIVTRTPKGERVAAPIWAMVVDGVPYLRSAYGSGSRWYRHVRSERPAEFALGDGAIAERDRPAALALPAEPVAFEYVPSDDPVQAAIDAELERKYAAEPSSVAAMQTPDAMGCTLRVVAPA